MTTLKTCSASGTLNQIIESESATPSKIDTQEKIVRRIPEKAIRKKKKTTMKIRDSKNPRG